MTKRSVETLYDEDFFEWTVRHAYLQREGRLTDADIEHVEEEIEDLGLSIAYAATPRVVSWSRMFCLDLFVMPIDWRRVIQG